MKLYYKLLLLYNFIRCFIGLYYNIADYTTIVQSPYTGLIQIYFLLSWAILLYLIYGSIKLLNNKLLNNRLLIFMLLFQFIWAICYISITSKPYMYIWYDFGICIFIYNCFFSYQYINNKNLQINNKFNNNEFNNNEFNNNEFNNNEFNNNEFNNNEFNEYEFNINNNRLINSVDYQDL